KKKLSKCATHVHAVLIALADWPVLARKRTPEKLFIHAAVILANAETPVAPQVLANVPRDFHGFIRIRNLSALQTNGIIISY
ncbi:16205_t:CDS:2, partial [Acaulospora morrowiae]